MLRSTAKVDPKGGGTVTNMNLSRTTAVEHRAEFSALLRTYFMLGGMQLNINCFNKGDLENALREPEKYQHLIVRVSGYSARFTDLNAVTQKHIMERTLF
jgi:pyruvate-formate lyase